MPLLILAFKSPFILFHFTISFAFYTEGPIPFLLFFLSAFHFALLFLYILVHLFLFLAYEVRFYWSKEKIEKKFLMSSGMKAYDLAFSARFGTPDSREGSSVRQKSGSDSSSGVGMLSRLSGLFTFSGVDRRSNDHSASNEKPDKENPTVLREFLHHSLIGGENDRFVWTKEEYQFTSKLPEERLGHSAVLYKRKVFYFGGRHGSTYYNDLLIYDLDSRVMEVKEPPTQSDALPYSFVEWPGVRCGHAGVRAKSRMYVLGGSSDGVKRASDFWSLDLETLQWRFEGKLSLDMPYKGHTLHYLSCAETENIDAKGVLICFGGVMPDNTLTNETWVFSLSRRQWSKLRMGGDIPCPRSLHASALIENTPHLLIFGGCRDLNANSNNSSAFLSDLYICNLLTGRWRALHPRGVPPSTRCCCSGVFVNSLFVIFGGGTFLKLRNDVVVYDPKLDEWKSVTLPSQPKRSSSSVVYAGDKLLMFGGWKPSRTCTNEIYQLSLAPLSLRTTCSLWLNEAHQQ